MANAMVECDDVQPGPDASLAVRPGTGVVLQLAHGPLVVLGTADGLGAKMTSLLTLLDRASLAGISQVDLRVPAEPVLTP